MQYGFKESPLRVNKGVGNLDTWNEATIRQRAKRLADQAAKVWGAPVLPADVLETYRPKAKRPAGYTLDDHAPLAEGSPMRPLFEEFRKEVLALDACVSEEIPEALRCLQGRDQLRGRGAPTEPSPPIAQHALP